MPLNVAHLLPRIMLGGLISLLMTLGAAALAQEPSGRVAQMTLVEGQVQVSHADAPNWQPLQNNLPLSSQSRIELPPTSRFDMSTGGSSWRMQGPGELDLGSLGDLVQQFQLQRGHLNLRVLSLNSGEKIEIDTPNLAVVVQQPGEYRLDVDPELGTTRVSVVQGSLIGYGENAQPMNLPAQRQWTFVGRQLALTGAPMALAFDNFDAWVSRRDQLEDQSLAARYIPREVIGYQQLDGWGNWQNDATYGSIWFPRVEVADWAPYRYGQWRWIAPWGWTWVDDAPWGFAPFHYGRWVVLGGRWAWVPGQGAHRPQYAPALVGFVGQPQQGGMGGGQPGVPWVPLAPGEAWRPGYPVSNNYLGLVNRPVRPIAGAAPLPSGQYVHQQRPEWITHQPRATGLAASGITPGGAMSAIPTPPGNPSVRNVPNFIPQGPRNDFERNQREQAAQQQRLVQQQMQQDRQRQEQAQQERQQQEQLKQQRVAEEERHRLQQSQAQWQAQREEEMRLQQAQHQQQQQQFQQQQRLQQQQAQQAAQQRPAQPNFLGVNPGTGRPVGNQNGNQNGIRIEATPPRPATQ
jgi:hypothetical protein